MTTEPTARTERRFGRPMTRVNGRTVPERILAAARDLFAEKGFGNTSVQDVVLAAGVTTGALYHYFSSKEDLLYELYGSVLRMQMERLVQIAGRDLPVAERVRAAAADVIVTAAENLPSTTIFARSLHRLSAERQREIRRERRRYHEIFRAMLLEGQETGVFRADVSADLLIDYHFGAVHHLPAWWHADGELSSHQVGEIFAGLLMDSIMRAPTGGAVEKA